MRLRPLEQFICDTCGQVIQDPTHGYVEWIAQNGKVSEIRIVHHALYSPRHPKGHCYFHERAYGRSDLSLIDFVGPRGIVQMLSFVDVGPYHQPTYSGPEVGDIRHWAEICRRLFVPYYEEARLYWQQALDDGFFDSANEIWLYLPSTLESLVKRYGDAKQGEPARP